MPHVPVPGRSAASIVLVVLLVAAALKWASAFFIPLMLGLLLSYALSPVVEALQRAHIPRALSAGVLIAGLLVGAGAPIYAFSDDANALIESLPEAAARLRDAVRQRASRRAPLDTVQKAAQQLEQAAAEAGARVAGAAALVAFQQFGEIAIGRCTWLSRRWRSIPSLGPCWCPG